MKALVATAWLFVFQCTLTTAKKVTVSKGDTFEIYWTRPTTSAVAGCKIHKGDRSHNNNTFIMFIDFNEQAGRCSKLAPADCKERFTLVADATNLTLRIRNVSKNDSDVYWPEYYRLAGPAGNEPVTLVVEESLKPTPAGSSTEISRTATQSKPAAGPTAGPTHKRKTSGNSKMGLSRFCLLIASIVIAVINS